MAAEPLPVIALLGDRQVGKETLLQRITSTQACSTSGVWDIDTKYYTARASLATANNPEDGRRLAAACEALVLVFDASQEASFQAVRDWESQLEAECAEVRLCIANKAEKLATSTGGIRAPWLQAAAQWCADHLYEYVEVSAADAEADAQLTLDGETQGVPRIMAALEAHTWPGLRLKDRHASAPAEPNGGALTTTEVTEGEQSASLDADADANGICTGPDGGAELVNGRSDAEALEQDMDDLEALMGQLSSARERMQGMADEDRRRAAADMALRLMHTFGLDADASSEDES